MVSSETRWTFQQSKVGPNPPGALAKGLSSHFFNRIYVTSRNVQFWVRMTMVLAMAAVLGNSYCYARCLSAVPDQTSSTARQGCHHSPDSKRSNHKQCGGQHWLEIANPDSQGQLAKVGVSAASLQIPHSTGSTPRFHVRWVAVNWAHNRDTIFDYPLFPAHSVLRL